MAKGRLASLKARSVVPEDLAAREWAREVLVRGLASIVVGLLLEERGSSNSHEHLELEGIRS